MTRTRGHHLHLLVLAACVAGWASPLASPRARAQDVALSGTQRQVAAEAAYDRGTRAYRGGDYDQAARWWETANELAPAAAALLQAIRAHERAGHPLRAGTLAASVASEYGEDRLGRRAARVLTRAAAHGLRVEVTCRDASGGTDCRLEVNGESEIFRTLFLPPDVEQVLVAIFPEGRVEERVRGGAGERREVVFEAPAPEPAPQPAPRVEPPPQPTTPRASPAPPVEPRGGLSPALFIVGLALTAATGAVAVWSWIDTLGAADQYEMAPTREALDAGRDLELRTTVLVVATAALGAATLTALLFTDFGGGERGRSAEPGTQVGLAPLPGGGAVSLRGRF